MSRRRSKRERDELRDNWRQHQKRRKLFEAHLAEIAELVKRGVVTDADLRNPRLFPELWIPPPPPAMKFINDRLQEVPHDDPEFDSKWKLAIVDLVKSDIPLDPRSRSLLAGELRRLYFPNAERDHREHQRMEAAVIDDLEEELLSRGMTVAQAREAVVQTLGKALRINNVDALRKRMQRAQK